MNDIIFTLFIGLGLGALYAMLGAGLVVSYKGSGVINFGYGAMAMYGLFTFDTAWNRGEFYFPWVDFLPTKGINIPVKITLSDSGTWPFAASLVLALLMAVGLGLAAHFLVFRPLRHAAPLGKVVASLGLALYLQGVALINFGNSFPQPENVVPEETIENFLGLGKPYPGSNLYVIAFAVLMGFVLWAAYRYLRFGLATRAAAGNEKGAVLLGFSPQTLAAINWVIASVLATLSVIIVGPIAGTITPVGLTALIVPALAAALIGGLRSIPIAVAGGLALGAVQTLLDVKKVTWFDGSFAWMQTGVRNFLPLVVIIVVLYARGKSLPIRGAVEEKRLPIAPDPRRVWEHAFFWIVVLTLMAFVFEDAGGRTRFANSMQTGLVVSIVMLSIVLITGYTGQISLAQMSFAGIAAFVMARMMADGIGRGSNLVPVEGPGLAWPIAGLIGIAAAVVVGVVVGLPAVRIRGVQLAVVTIAAAVALQGLYFENPEITQLRAGVPAFVKDPTIFGIDVGARSAREQNENPAFVIFGAIVLALCAIAVANMRRSGVGRRFLAVRANERAAASAGINVTRTKLLAFAISAAIAGVGGLMLGFKQVEVSSANFAYGASLSVLAFAYLAGISSISGAIVAGMLLQALVPTTSNYFFAGTNIDNYIGLLSGIGIIVTAIVHPEGVAPFFTEGVRHLGNWTVSAIPGAETLRSNYRGPKQVLVKVGLAILVVGTALWLYNAKFIESVEWWVFLSMVLLFLITLAFARVVGPISPTFGEAGHVWASAGKRFGPTALVGYVLGWIIWPLRVDTYSMFWMPILGALIALMVRNVYLQIRGGHEAPAAEPPTDTPQLATTLPTPAGGN